MKMVRNAITLCGAGALVATRLACSDAMPTRPELDEFLGVPS